MKAVLLFGCSIVALAPAPVAAQSAADNTPPSTTRSTANTSPDAVQATADNSLPDTTRATPVTENGPVPDVVVTAQRRTESLQKAAASITVRDGQETVREGKVTLRQILEDVPGVTDASQVNIIGPTAGTYVVIRGLATDQNNGPGINPSATAVYVDGVFEGFGGTFDLERVEVLRGPQGTLYGRSATAGVVAISTIQPKLGTFTGDLNGEYGTANLLRLQGGINLPIGDKLAVRVSGSEVSADGYDARRGIGRREITDFRVKLLYQPTDDLRLLLGYTHEQASVYSGGIQFDNIASGYADYTGPNAVISSSFPISLSTSRSQQFNGTADWNLGPAVLSYLGSYQEYNNSVLSFLPAGPPGAAPIQSTVNIPTYNSLSQELHLASAPGSKLTWIGGLIYFRNQVRNSNVTLSTASGARLFYFDFAKTTRDLGAFAQATYPLSDTTRLTAGLRYDNTQVQTSETYTVNNGGPPVPPFLPIYGLPEVLVSSTLSGPSGARQFNNLTFKARLEHDLSPDNLVYALAATGFLPGDVRVTTVASQPIATPYDQQTLTSFEIGTKNRFFGGNLILNGSIYYNTYTGYQISTNVNAGRANAQPNNVFLQSPARMYGFDLDSVLRLSRHDRISVAAGYTNAHFVNKPNTTLNPFAANFVRDEIPNVAPWTVSPTYLHTFEIRNGLSIVGRVNGVYTSAYDIMPFNTLTLTARPLARQPGHMIGNADVTINLDKAYITAYVRNFTDKRYVTSYIGFGNLTSTDVTVGLTDPRTVGVVLGTHF